MKNGNNLLSAYFMPGSVLPALREITFRTHTSNPMKELPELSPFCI